MKSILSPTEYNSINALSEELKASLNKCQLRREQWAGTVKPEILRTLRLICDQCELSNMIIDHIEPAKGEEVINVFFSKNKGVLFNDQSLQRALSEVGARLCFAPIYNAKISVFIVYPTFEGYEEPAKLLGIHEPFELQQNIIIRYFEKFLIDLIKSED